MITDNEPAAVPDPVEPAVEEPNPTPDGNEPETQETPQEEGSEETTTTEVEGASEETDSPEEKKTDKEKPQPEAPETFDVDGEKVKFDEFLSAWKNRKETEKFHKEAQDLHDTAKLVLTEIAKDTRGAVIDILTGIHKSREKAADAFLEICKEEVTRAWEFAQKPEAERRSIQLEKELSEKQKKLEEYQKREESEKFESQKAERANALLGEINTAIKSSGLSDDPRTVKLIANVLLTTRSEGHQVTASEAARLVKEELEQISAAKLKATPLEEIQANRPDLVNEIRKNDLAQVRANRQAKKPARVEPKKRPAEQGPRIVNSVEIQELLRR